ncbi:MAG: hypothetical protein SVX38_17125, partial [Chloroflexota bacterium]|nr:hypothetical protein [Chloroflexota bacterium]
MRSKRTRCVILSAGLAALGVLALLTPLGALHVTAQGAGVMWPLTSDGHSRFAGWSPDGRTVLINRWGAVVGDENSRLALSELWAIPLPPDGQEGQGAPATRLSENATRPAYSSDGRRLAYLAFAGDGRWQARVLDPVAGHERSWGAADWRTPPTWVGEALALAQDGRVWLSSEGVTSQAAGFPTLPAGARVHLTADGTRAAWSDGSHLWAVPHPGAAPRLLASDTQVLSFAWSPDGRRLAYVVATEGPAPELWTAAVDGWREPVLLVQGQAEMFSTPSWSPDGLTLAFSRTPLGAETASAADIWLASADGSDLRPLLRNDLEESGPVWSPDGRYLAFNRAGDVWLLDVSRMPPLPPARGGEHISLPPDREKGRGSGEDFS